ncbi:MAG TPA: hypothetical protein VJ997_04705 [Longimicrobiales bacterium]|nr:hypothetical protein [Longimicrobiales bacterium]
MIARTWRGSVAPGDAESYLDYLKVTGIRDYRGTPGNRGVFTLSRDAGEQVEFFMVSLWDSWDAVRGFAGPSPEVAVFYPEDDRFLVNRDPLAHHFEVVDAYLPTRGLLARWWAWWWEGWKALLPERGMR